MRSGGVTGLHPTKDGWLYISANTPHFWAALCELTGLQDLAADPRYDSVRKRAANTDAIVARLRAALAERTALEWEAVFGERVPCSAARAVEDMFNHPQVLAEGLVTHVEHPTVGGYRGLRDPIRFGRTPCVAPGAPPLLGQHTREVLAERGFGADEIERLRADGAFGDAAGEAPADGNPT